VSPKVFISSNHNKYYRSWFLDIVIDNVYYYCHVSSVSLVIHDKARQIYNLKRLLVLSTNFDSQDILGKFMFFYKLYKNLLYYISDDYRQIGEIS
jgi:hypothetical protein